MAGLEDWVTSRLTTDRKLRLYAAAAWRHLWRDAVAEASASAAEAYADGLGELRPGAGGPNDPDAFLAATEMAYCMAAAREDVGRDILGCLAGSPGPVVVGSYVRLGGGMAWPSAAPTYDGVAVRAEGGTAWAVSLGSGRGQVVADADVCPAAWRTPDVLSLARAAYGSTATVCRRCGGTRRLEKNGSDHRCPDCPPGGTLDGFRLHLLADALEEAGCPSGHPLAAHLRAGSHWRGCWMIDAVLGLS